MTRAFPVSGLVSTDRSPEQPQRRSLSQHAFDSGIELGKRERPNCAAQKGDVIGTGIDLWLSATVTAH
ncbi:MAG: hypothetical protein AAFY15_03060 [Cyanobacteria bacterium J06648_11]